MNEMDWQIELSRQLSEVLSQLGKFATREEVDSRFKEWAVKQEERTRRFWKVTAFLVVFAFSVPASISASIAVYHLTSPTHTIVQNLPHKGAPNAR